MTFLTKGLLFSGLLISSGGIAVGSYVMKNSSNSLTNSSQEKDDNSGQNLETNETSSTRSSGLDKSVDAQQRDGSEEMNSHSDSSHVPSSGEIKNRNQHPETLSPESKVPNSGGTEEKFDDGIGS